jgi:hypothetical protein
LLDETPTGTIFELHGAQVENAIAKVYHEFKGGRGLHTSDIASALKVISETASLLHNHLLDVGSFARI